MIVVIEILLVVLACMVLAGIILYVARIIETIWEKKDD